MMNYKEDMYPVQVIFENDDLVAVNKPPGLLTIPDRFDPELPSLKNILAGKFGELFVVHRLDRDTSGLILFAKNAEAHQYYSRLFEERRVVKQYLGLVQGTLARGEGTFDQPIAEHPTIKGRMAVHRKGKPSVTHYRVIENFRSYSWLEIQIETGRTHQIRVHLQNAGHPIVCDPLYGSETPLFLSSLKRHFKLSRTEEEERPLLNRLGLHSFRLSFTDPSGKQITLEAPLHKDMQATLKQLRKWSGGK